eukprot:scaffold1351_cov176-Amphora_coffeaeformis.AAC.14
MSLSGRKGRPSTATLQQFAASSSYSSNGAFQKTASSNDNTSATTAESTSWSSRSGHHHGVFPRSHPQREPQHSQQTQSSPFGARGGTSQQYQQQPNQHQHQYAASSAGGGDRYYASSTQSGRSPVQQHRHTYRDDYSRSQHSDQDDTNSFTPPGPQTDISLEITPPRVKKQEQPPNSDPGASNRFAAYVNRFATIDPRMDYSAGMHSPTRGTQFEEKKEDPRSWNQRKQHRLVDEADYFPDPDFSMEQMLAAEQRQHQRPQSMAGSTASTSALHSPRANRTRHLAQRFEERMSTRPETAASPPWYRDTASYRERSQERASSGYQEHEQQRQQPGERLPNQHYEQQQQQVTMTSSPQQELGTYQQQEMGVLAAELDYRGRRSLSNSVAAEDTSRTSRSNSVPAEDYRSRSEIETPSPARVAALKQKLWDASESLNVKVRPSSNGRPMPDGMRSARSLSPKTSRRISQHFGGRAAAEPVPSRSSTPLRNPTHFEWTESRPQAEDPRDDRSRSSAPRDDRSRSSINRDDPSLSISRDDRSNHTSGREDRSQGRDDRSRSSAGESSRRRSLNNPRALQPASDHFEGGGGELQNSPFFKSRFFEAAAQSVDHRKMPSLSRANSSSSSVERGIPAIAPSQSNISHQDSLTASRFFQRQLDAADEMIMEPGPQNVQQRPSSSSLGSGTRNVGVAHPRANSAVGGTSYASTPIISNQQENVASLLAKLQSVNRSDPSAALQEIDAILKAQVGGGSAVAAALRRDMGMTSAPIVPPQSSLAPGPTPVEDDDGESESETTVSSITNPTFSGHSTKHRKKREEGKKLQSQPLPTTVEGEATDHVVKPLKEPADFSGLRRKKPRSPPPGTINVSGNRGAARNVDHNMDRKLLPNRGTPRFAMGEECHVVDAVDEVLSPALDSTAELAEKIRRWDELSGKGSAPDVKIPEIQSDTTEALGSIVTPSDGLPNINKKKSHHPWDASIPTRRGKIDMKDTSMDIGEGIETKYSSNSPNKQSRQETVRRREDERNNPFADESHNPFAQESDHESMQASQTSRSREGPKGGGHAPQATLTSMSQEFDDAWVTLPTSNFFTADTPPRRTTDKSSEDSRARSDESPPPPPVSTKQASVQKFSPKRLDSAKGGVMDYEPPSPSSRRRERSDDAASRGVSAYDENLVDQAPSEEEYDDGIEVTLVGGRKETKRKGLRALLQRRNSKPQGLSAASVVSSSSRRRNQTRMAAYEAEVEPPRSASRGRRRSGASPSRARAHSLEERRIRNPNIARKFSRFLRVYNDEDRRPAEV